jgi:hypothetical protein
MSARISSLTSVLEASGFEQSVRRILVDPAPQFYRMIVLEVIFDPSIIDETKIEYWETVLGVSNARFGTVLPRNTIIAQKILRGVTELSRPMFLLPFFPSHISLPCKPGEMVWAMFEDPNARMTEMGYWFCRISEPHFIDDVNHVHSPRQFDHSLINSTSGNAQGAPRVYENRLGKVVLNENGERIVERRSEIIARDEEDFFEGVLTNTDGGKLMQYESVPRFRKRPGDIAFEGTNNSLIVLGTDRPGPVALYKDEAEKGLVPQDTGGLIGNAGSIDLVVGRGTLPETGGAEVEMTEINTGVPVKKELGKMPEDTVPYEGDPDFTNDRSRVLISQRTRTDSNFGTSGYNSQFGISDSQDGNASIVIKTDKIRLIARSDISLIVKNFTAQPASGSKPELMLDNTDETKWASITIKTNGDIVFKPSSDGFIKLGDDTADKAILCTDKPAIQQNGTATFSPGIITTGADVVGTGSPNQGTFAKKILVL